MATHTTSRSQLAIDFQARQDAMNRAPISAGKPLFGVTLTSNQKQVIGCSAAVVLISTTIAMFF